ncbi:hypothetical protein [Pseudomonas sp. NA-150]|uniref:hypothetical protein n=1 Tax=Pseudomonas sp. NA-150 TaxID=3367525 RepID=UPI0037C8F3A3
MTDIASHLRQLEGQTTPVQLAMLELATFVAEEAVYDATLIYLRSVVSNKGESNENAGTLSFKPRADLPLGKTCAGLLNQLKQPLSAEAIKAIRDVGGDITRWAVFADGSFKAWSPTNNQYVGVDIPDGDLTLQLQEAGLDELRADGTLSLDTLLSYYNTAITDITLANLNTLTRRIEKNKELSQEQNLNPRSPLALGHLSKGELEDYDETEHHLGSVWQNASFADSLERVRIEPCPTSPFGEVCFNIATHLRQQPFPALVDAINRAGADPERWLVTIDGTFKAASNKGDGYINIPGVTLTDGQLDLLKQYAQRLGGQAHCDGKVSLATMLRANYGLHIPTTATYDYLIVRLDEHRSTQWLGLNQFTEIDKHLGNNSAVTSVLSICSEHFSGQTGTLLKQLKGAGRSYSDAELNRTPIKTIVDLFKSPGAQILAQKLEDALITNTTNLSPTTREKRKIKLLWKAISADLTMQGTSTQPSGSSYEIAKPYNWGRCYSTLRADYERYLIQSGRASAEDVKLVTHILAFEAHPDLLVDDIPADLPYGSSLVWVNFLHGVNLAEATEQGSAQWMGFQALVDLPSVMSAKATTDNEHALTTAMRLAPVLIWATANGLLRKPSNTAYSDSEIEYALLAFEKHKEQIITAMNKLSDRPPERRAMAMAEIEGTRINGRALNPNMLLVLKDYRHHLNEEGFRHFGDYPGVEKNIRHLHALIDVYMSGVDIELYKEPRTYRGEPPVRLTPQQLLIYKNLPNINQAFDNKFGQYLTDTTSAYQTIIKTLLSMLPLEHRINIEQGEIRLFSLRGEVGDVLAKKETEEHKEPLRGRQGFIIESRYDNKINYYEVLPLANAIRHRADLTKLVPDGKIEQESWTILGTVQVAVNIRRATNLPFDWTSYQRVSGFRTSHHTSAVIAEPIGNSLPALSSPDNDDPPKTLLSQRSRDIATLVTTHLFYVNPENLRVACEEITSVEIENKGIPGVFTALSEILAPISPITHLSDMLSGEKNRVQWGSIHMLLNVITWVAPAGRLLSGLVKIAMKAGKFVFSGALKTSISTAVKALPGLLSSSATSFSWQGFISISKTAANYMKKTATKVAIFILNSFLGWKAISRQLAQRALAQIRIEEKTTLPSKA